MTVSFFTILCNCLYSIGYVAFSSVFIDEIFFDYVLFRFSHFCKSTGARNRYFKIFLGKVALVDDRKGRIAEVVSRSVIVSSRQEADIRHRAFRISD